MFNAYQLQAGDTVYVDSGTYNLVSNITVSTPGIRIQGAQQSGHATILNRGNTNAGSYVMELVNADSLELDHLSFTGAARGIYASPTSDSDGVKITNSRVYDNTQEEIWLEATNDNVTVTGSTLFDTVNSGNTNYAAIHLAGNTTLVENNEIYRQGTGMWLAGKANTVRGNRVHDNTPGAGIYLGVTGDTGSTVTNNVLWGNLDGIDIQSSGTTTIVENNQVYSSSRYGIYLVSGAVARSNMVTSSADTGIVLDNSTLAENNTVFANQNGITANRNGVGSTIRNNRVFNNTVYGIAAFHESLIEGNTVFGNQTGIAGLLFSPFTGDILNNVIYNNSVRGISVERGVSGAVVKNNSIYQPQGVGIDIGNSSSNVELRNNIIEVQSGTAIVVATNSQVGFRSNYNLIYTPAPVRSATGAE